MKEIGYHNLAWKLDKDSKPTIVNPLSESLRKVTEQSDWEKWNLQADFKNSNSFIMIACIAFSALLENIRK